MRSCYRAVWARPACTKGNGWRRIVVEKPFGHDLASARELSDEIHEVFPEKEVYRIDHYLGKETVQNILAFRFGNGIFEPLWNRRYVNHVQITAAESIGVEGRGAYYQEAGALRDMIQNHLLQVMATVAMEPPAVFDADNVRDERAKLLRAIRVMKPRGRAAVRRGRAIRPRERSAVRTLPGFRQEEGVDPNAQTDTYAAATFFIDNWRWAGVPFYIRTGKRLPKRVTDIAIQFNCAAACHVRAGNATRPALAAAESADPAHSAGRGNLAALPSKSPGQRHARAPGLDGFQLRLELRRALADRLRDAAAGCHGRRPHALHAAGYGGGKLAGRGADPERLAEHEIRFPELCGGNLGTEGVRRNAGAAGPCMEGSMSTSVIPAQPEKILKALGKLWTSLGEEERQQGKPTVLRACAMTLIVRRR